MTLTTSSSDRVLSVDLASRFSASMVVDSAGEVLASFDSFSLTPVVLAQEIARAAVFYDVKYIVIEDVPYGLSRQAMIKPVLRLQGILIAEFARADVLDRVFWLNPSTWQRDFEGVWKGGPEGARKAAESLGYTAPDLLDLYEHLIPEKGHPDRAKVRAQLRKASTDYPDAFLIAVWSLKQDSLPSVKGIQPTYL